MTLEELLEARSKYQQAKEKYPDKWTEKFQEQLGEIEAEITRQEPAKEPEYIPVKGTENLFHVSIVKGRRFNPNTGKPEAKPYIQLFSTAEFRVFEQASARLGYTILKILHEPA